MSGAFTLAIHGGAGRVPSRESDPDWSEVAHAGMRAALEAGHQVLRASGAALDAVVAAVAALESCPAYNAGLGSVANTEGVIEMDASVMEGTRHAAGAVAGLRRTAHPIEAARAVLLDGRHLFLAGEGAEGFAAAAGLAEIEPSALRAAAPRRSRAGGATVGAVACDRHGHLAAATSTGGTPGKRPGRVSDSALIGSGTWADDASCAVSTTGHGEAFIRCAFAHAVHARVEAGEELTAACARMLERVAQLDGEGGCISLDARGHATLPFDTPAMPRALLREGEAPRIAIHAEDELSSQLA